MIEQTIISKSKREEFFIEYNRFLEIQDIDLNKI